MLRASQAVTRSGAAHRATVRLRSISTYIEPKLEEELVNRLRPVCRENNLNAKRELAWIKEHGFLKNSQESHTQLVQERINQIKLAKKIDPLLPSLLGPCDDIASAQRELQWIREHVQHEDPEGAARIEMFDKIRSLPPTAERVLQCIREDVQHEDPEDSTRIGMFDKIKSPPPTAERDEMDPDYFWHALERLERHDLEKYHSIQEYVEWLMMDECEEARDRARLESKSKDSKTAFFTDPANWDYIRLRLMCAKRRQGTPLQQLLGSVYFGDIKLPCSRGVLIPRDDTAAQVTHLVKLIRDGSSGLPRKIRVLDLCSGSGCMSFLLAHSFPYQDGRPRLDVTGVDYYSEAALQFKQNADYLTSQLITTDPTHPAIPTLRSARCVVGNLLSDSDRGFNKSPRVGVTHLIKTLGTAPCDIILANPPYISAEDYDRDIDCPVSMSVKRYEPRMALVPRKGMHQDAFYPRILQIAKKVGTKIVLMEVGDMDQARRVAQMAIASGRWDGIEIWRDDLNAHEVETSEEEIVSPTNGHKEMVKVAGKGHGRSVVCWRRGGAYWLGKKQSNSTNSSISDDAVAQQ